MNPKLLQSAYILHTRPFSETSLLVELLTHDGRISVIAKGAKRPKSMFRGILQPFIPLTISYSGRNELKTLTYAQVKVQQPLLQGHYLLAALYLNELLMRLLLKESPCAQLFSAYENALMALFKQENLWICLRLFEKELLSALGYELNLSHDAQSLEAIDVNAQYIYILEKGPVRVENVALVAAKTYIFSGKCLLDLSQNNLSDPISQQQAKQLLRVALQVYLGERALHSRDLFTPMVMPTL